MLELGISCFSYINPVLIIHLGQLLVSCKNCVHYLEGDGREALPGWLFPVLRLLARTFRSQAENKAREPQLGWGGEEGGQGIIIFMAPVVQGEVFSLLHRLLVKFLKLK